jgi:molybdopterin-binding protein
MAVSSNIGIGWRSTENLGQGTAYNTLLFRESTGVIGQYNSLFDAPQAFNIYNTWTDASNYERLELKWDSNIATIATTSDGTGSDRLLKIQGGNNVELWSGIARVVRVTYTELEFHRSRIRPAIDGAGDLGSSGYRWGSIYTDTITIGDGVDAVLTADAADTLALRNGTNAQQLNVYSTWTDASNYERIEIKFDGTDYRIKPDNAGTGSDRGFILSGALTAQSNFIFSSNGNSAWRYNATSNLYIGAGYVRASVNFQPDVDSSVSNGTTSLRWATTYTDAITIGDGVDAILTADAANELALRNGTNAQKFNLYGTYTD